MYSKIKRSLIGVLKQVKDIDISFERVEKTRDIPEFFSVLIMPISKKTRSVNLYFDSYFVDIAYFSDDFSNSKAMDIAKKIDDKLRPTLFLKDFSVLVEETNTKVVDDVLHINFSLDIEYEVIYHTDEKMMSDLSLKIDRS